MLAAYLLAMHVLCLDLYWKYFLHIFLMVITETPFMTEFL